MPLELVDKYFGSSSPFYRETARAICSNCPVQVECLQDAMRRPSVNYGIRAGANRQVIGALARRVARGESSREVAVEAILRQEPLARMMGNTAIRVGNFQDTPLLIEADVMYEPLRFHVPESLTYLQEAIHAEMPGFAKRWRLDLADALPPRTDLVPVVHEFMAWALDDLEGSLRNPSPKKVLRNVRRLYEQQAAGKKVVGDKFRECVELAEHMSGEAADGVRAHDLAVWSAISDAADAGFTGDPRAIGSAVQWMILAAESREDKCLLMADRLLEIVAGYQHAS